MRSQRKEGSGLVADSGSYIESCEERKEAQEGGRSCLEFCEGRKEGRKI